MSRALLLNAAASGAAGSSDPVYVDDVFSTFLYDGTGDSQFIENGIDLGRAPVKLIESVDSGAVDKTVTVAASTKLVVFALNTSNSVLGCSVNSSSLSTAADLSANAHNYRTVIYVATLSGGSNRIQVDNNGLGHTEVFLINSNATVTVNSSANWSTTAASVAPTSFTSNGFGLALLSDRDPSSNFTASGSATALYEKGHTYFRFEAFGIPGSGSQVPQTTFSGLTSNYAGGYAVLNITGIGTNPIANSVDSAGKGGLVWTKRRSASASHYLHDTERGANKNLLTNSSNAEGTLSNGIVSFSSTGYTVGSADKYNGSSNNYVSWTFRKQEKFFDVVTYSGTGSAQNISHNLGSVPGMIMVKRTSGVEDWICYHRSTGNGKGSGLNQQNATFTSTAYWNSTTPTDSVFTVGTHDRVNTNGHTYVAYLFAHDEQDFGTDSDEAIIKCGSYTGNSGSQTIDLGFEAQWVLIKNTTSGSTDWFVVDIMRGIGDTSAVDASLIRANANDAEQTSGAGGARIAAKTTGFGFLVESNLSCNRSGETYIYVAIRRPNKPASEFAATDMFKPQVKSAGEGSDTFISTGFPVDAVLYTKRTSNATNVLGTRLTGGQKIGGDLKTDSSDAQSTNSGAFFLDHNNGVTVDFSGGHFNVAPAATNNDYARYYFRRVPEFFDVVTYTGNGANRTIAHNLGVAPELMIIKSRSNGFNWQVYVSASGASKRFILNSTSAELAHNDNWNTTAPTASVFSLGTQSDVNHSGATFIALLFASASGISKIGSYSGTGSSQNIDCGFSNGSRFVLIKNKNNAGGWYFWDSERGITANNDPFLRLGANDGDQNYTGDDINPHSSGFNVSSNNNAVNRSGRDYIFLAIA